MKQDKRTAFILAAGLGTRLKELTRNTPKALVSINKKPLLEVILEELIRQGFNHIVVNIHHFGEQIMGFLEDFTTKLHSGRNDGTLIEISDERTLLMDTGGAILQALPLFSQSEAVLVHNVDVLTNVDLQGLYNDFLHSDDAAWLLTQERQSKRKLVFDNHDNFLGRFNVENECFDGGCTLPNDCKLLSFSGIHIFKPQFFKDFDKNPCYIFELYQKIAENHRVKSELIHPDYWFDLGTIEQLKNAEQWLSLRR